MPPKHQYMVDILQIKRDDNWNDAVFGNALFANEDSYGLHESELKAISAKKS